MATFDELRLQELLKVFDNQSNNTGITTIDQQYTDPKYTYDGLYQENYGNYDERMDPTEDPYGMVFGTGQKQPSMSSAFPLDFSGTESTFAPRIGLPNQVPQNLAFLPNQVPQIQVPQANNQNAQLPANRLEGLDFSRFQSLPANMGAANEDDVEQEFLSDQEPSGIAKLFQLLGKIPTPFNLVRKGLGSLKGFNQKLRGSTFALSPTLSDYFKAKRMEKKAAIGADRPGDGGDGGSRRGDADIANKDRGSFKTDDTAGFF